MFSEMCFLVIEAAKLKYSLPMDIALQGSDAHLMNI
jgi:hypothetical protein